MWLPKLPGGTECAPSRPRRANFQVPFRSKNRFEAFRWRAVQSSSLSYAKNAARMGTRLRPTARGSKHS